MREKLKKCRDTDEEVNDVRDGTHAKDRRNQIPSKRHQEPVQTSNNEKDERNDVNRFHINNTNPNKLIDLC